MSSYMSSSIENNTINFSQTSEHLQQINQVFENQEPTMLNEVFTHLSERSKYLSGYPVSTDFNYDDLMHFLHLPLNNIGDPFEAGTYQVGTHNLERQVVEFFAALFRFPVDDFWGYITNGGTEGNLYGLYLARELYPNGIVYFSEDTHYSVSKNVHFLNMRHIMIKSQSNGEIDYDDLQETLKIHRDVPAIIFANIGTTMKEGKDNVAKIHHILDDVRIHERYIHADGALCGSFAQFMPQRPSFDFVDGADSVAISGHKFLGSPIPCGVVIAKHHLVKRIARSIGYIGTLDTTITGSRNGVTPIILWRSLQKMGGLEGLRQRYLKCEALAHYTYEYMQKNGLTVWRNPGALTLFFPEVKDWVKNKWQIATQGVSHIIVMPGVTQELIHNVVADIVQAQNK
jgi:histidine decarboxylase